MEPNQQAPHFVGNGRQGRGVGTVPGTCDAATQVKSGLLCYEKPKAGYTMVAGVAWQQCPADFKDTGDTFVEARFLRPCEYANTWADWNKDKCEAQAKSQGKEGCDKSGAFWYHKCKKNFHAVGCCVCSPDCPAGTKDIGVSCTKTAM